MVLKYFILISSGGCYTFQSFLITCYHISMFIAVIQSYLSCRTRGPNQTTKDINESRLGSWTRSCNWKEGAVYQGKYFPAHFCNYTVTQYFIRNFKISLATYPIILLPTTRVWYLNQNTLPPFRDQMPWIMSLATQ